MVWEPRGSCPLPGPWLLHGGGRRIPTHGSGSLMVIWGKTTTVTTVNWSWVKTNTYTLNTLSTKAQTPNRNFQLDLLSNTNKTRNLLTKPQRASFYF